MFYTRSFVGFFFPLTLRIKCEVTSVALEHAGKTMKTEPCSSFKESEYGEMSGERLLNE